MSRSRLIRAIPLFILTSICINSWVLFLTNIYIVNLRQYLALLILGVNIFFFFKNDKISTFITGSFLLLAIFNILVYTVTVNSFWFRIADLFNTPEINLLSLGLFLLYFMLNFDFLVNWYYDYKESKGKL
jgi:hypothetical protein